MALAGVVVISTLFLSAVVENLPLLAVLVADPAAVEGHVHAVLALP